MMRKVGVVAYTCHDSFPSSDINTQQIFRTVLEVTRLGVTVELTIPSIGGQTPERGVPGSDPHVNDARGTLMDYYGATGEEVPETFHVRPITNGPAGGEIARGWFDWRVPAHLRARQIDLVWTRDPLAAASCVRAGLPTVFETFRPDLATRERFALWRRVVVGSSHLLGVITHSHLAADAFALAGVPRDRCLVAHNGFAPALMAPVLDRAEARRRLGLPLDQPLVVYAGHPARDKGIDVMFNIAAGVRGAQVLVLGADPQAPEDRRLAKDVEKARLANLRLLPRVRVADVAPYLYAADCLVVTPYDQPGTRHRRGMLPIKLYSYLAAGRAIVAPRLPDMQEIVADGDTAQLYDPRQPQDAVLAVQTVLARDDLRAHLGRQAVIASARFTWSVRARSIVEFFNRIVHHPRSATAAAAISRV